ncbi:molybdenum cofactor guanylyltransferase [Pacificibacter maritimus]|uniref:Molybdenum cofactor guanylyltransferase n=1 Tax=Pacificibacter maritimus TaxID=762213 RepID=A0A3N4U913_9RHOB|nr:molybdenum cofactor guanylyltransferase MobA [Pacificibacter maritimus]RPE67223.1 molybdenum cofactor guanylyltransferase [Pacificibacter maritimus]
MPEKQMDKATSSTATVILAGGRGRRLGGSDKALRILNADPLVQHCLRRLKDQEDVNGDSPIGPVALNSNCDARHYADFGLPIIADTIGADYGPLAGILAAMDWACDLGHAQVMTIAVDTPFFPKNLTARLVAERTDMPIAMAATVDAQGHVWPQPTFGLWATDLRNTLRDDLETGARKVITWARSQGVTSVQFKTGTQDPFFNINTPEDLALAQTILMQEQDRI